MAAKGHRVPSSATGVVFAGMWAELVTTQEEGWEEVCPGPCSAAALPGPGRRASVHTKQQQNPFLPKCNRSRVTDPEKQDNTLANETPTAAPCPLPCEVQALGSALH